MSNTKSILEIEIHDAQFKEFETAFNRYQTAVKNDRKLWADTNDHIGRLPRGINEATRSLSRFNETAKASNGSLSSIEATLGGIFKMAGKTAIAIGAVVAVVGKLSFEAAQNASNLRKQAQGKNMGIGQMSALDTYYSKTLNSGSDTASKILAAKNSFQNRQLFSLFKIDMNASADDQVKQATMGLKDILDQYGPQNGIAMAKEAYGAGALFQDEEMVRVQNTSREELLSQAANVSKRKKQMDISDDAAKKAQNFAQEVDAAGKTVANRLSETASISYDAGRKLAEGFAETTQKSATYADALIEGAKDVHSLGDAAKFTADRLATLLPSNVMSSSTQARIGTDLKNTISADTDALTHPMDTLKRFGKWATTPVDFGAIKDLWNMANKPLFGGDKGHTGSDIEYHPENIRKAYDRFLPKYGHKVAANIASNIFLESKGDPLAVGDGGWALGIGQHHKNRRDAYGKEWPTDSEGQLDFLEWEMENTERDAMSKVIAGKKTFGEAYERPADIQKRLTGERSAEKILINTGVIPGMGKMTVNIKPTPGMDVSTSTTAIGSVR